MKHVMKKTAVLLFAVTLTTLSFNTIAETDSQLSAQKGKDSMIKLQGYLKAAESGDVDSMEKAATMYLEDDGVPLDCGVATKWYKNARKLYVIPLDDINNGACKYLSQWRETKRIYKSMNEIASTANWAQQPKYLAQYEALEKELLNKLDVLIAKDVNAARCFKGDILFGGMVDDGARRKEGIKLLKEGSDIGGQNCLRNFMFSREQGIGEDSMSSIELNTWMLRAAGRGDIGAMGNLAYSYEAGREAEQDYIRAYMWSYIRAEYAHMSVDEAVADILPKLSPKKLAAAQKLIKEWKLKHPLITKP